MKMAIGLALVNRRPFTLPPDWLPCGTETGGGATAKHCLFTQAKLCHKDLNKGVQWPLT